MTVEESSAGTLASRQGQGLAPAFTDEQDTKADIEPKNDGQMSIVSNVTLAGDNQSKVPTEETTRSPGGKTPALDTDAESFMAVATQEGDNAFHKTELEESAFVEHEGRAYDGENHSRQLSASEAEKAGGESPTSPSLNSAAYDPSKSDKSGDMKFGEGREATVSLADMMDAARRAHYWNEKVEEWISRKPINPSASPIGDVVSRAMDLNCFWLIDPDRSKLAEDKRTMAMRNIVPLQTCYSRIGKMSKDEEATNRDYLVRLVNSMHRSAWTSAED